MKVKVGVVGQENVEVTMFLNEDDEEVQNFTKWNYTKVALAIVRRKLKGTGVYPIFIGKPEWYDSLPEKAHKGEHK